MRVDTAVAREVGVPAHGLRVGGEPTNEPVEIVDEDTCGVSEVGPRVRPGPLRGPLVFVDEAAEDGSALDPLMGKVGGGVVGLGCV